MPTFTTTVIVHCDTAAQAERVLNERTGHDEDYGFDYDIAYGRITPEDVVETPADGLDYVQAKVSEMFTQGLTDGEIVARLPDCGEGGGITPHQLVGVIRSFYDMNPWDDLDFDELDWQEGDAGRLVATATISGIPMHFDAIQVDGETAHDQIVTHSGEDFYDAVAMATDQASFYSTWLGGNHYVVFAHPGES